ncbi:MMPL family transporter [Lentzea sp. NPDC059081]|uniref:MMPL family transporter n=1 Tax=Lentzea sp. NPDC059081 TaxID=3346719 RepID=UPI0036BF24AB
MLPGHRSDVALVERVAAWSVRHRGLAVAGWLLLVLLAVLVGALSGDGASARDPGESGRAAEVLDQQRSYAPVRENVLVEGAGTDDLVTALRGSGAVTELSVSGETPSLVTFHLAGPDAEVAAHYDTVVRLVAEASSRHPDTRFSQAGDRSLAKAVDQAIKDDFQRSELISLPITVLILLVVFGALVAASVPLLLAGTTVAAAFGLLGLVGTWIPVNSATSSMILLIGVAVGIDYSLFYLRREREERAAGRSVAEALRISARTSGRVVLVSGLTVVLCVAGLLFTGLANFRGLTVGTVLVVGLAVVGSVTALPAVLSLLGHRVDGVRVPFLRRTHPRESRLWTAVARVVVRRPWLWGGLAVLSLLVLAVPALGMRLQDAGATNSLPRSVAAVDGAIRMQEAFPGTPTPAQVVLSGRGDDVDVSALRREIASSGGLLHEPLTAARVDSALVLRVPLAGTGTDDLSNRAMEHLRTKALPAAFGDVPGVSFAVSGRTAFAYDFTAQVRATTPLVFGFVLLLAFVLLVVAFRALAIPLISIGLNVLSIGAAYGVLTWVFQDGHLESVLGFTSYGGVVGWLPLFMFVLLFGLSMDYHIFILSRIRERWSGGADARAAIVGGVGGSAGVVTSAAVIMTAVFAVFVTLSAIEYKMLGVGMAVAILVDATLVRGVLLPAAMAVLGERAWVLPGGLGRFSHVPGLAAGPSRQRAAARLGAG